jgi:DEAD/DEAH box helicase domain-containing protein
MFKSGIALGLKKYFKGNPQHIIISEYREYNEINQKFDKYLVLYDSIPGGTGYLEKLFDWREFNELLKIAYQEIKNCECQHEGKDGCYRCIYSYSNQYDQEELSREKAEKRFEKIVKQSEGWQSNVTGLSSITNNGYIEESELEERFIRSLRILGQKEDNWEFKEVNQDGIISYTLTYQSFSDTNFAYHIRPQVDLGPKEGIEYHTRTDFLITCTFAEINGNRVEDLLQIPKIAIYLDGFQYHASEENNRFVNDFEKRNAINKNRDYKTWSLTWDDIEKFDQRFLPINEQNSKTDFLEELFDDKGFKQTKSKLLKVVRNDIINVSEAKNNVERLLKYLIYPILDTSFYKSWSLYAGLFQESFLKPSYHPEHIAIALKGVEYQQYCIDNKSLNGLVRFGGIPTNNLFNIQSVINIQKSKIECVLTFLNTESIDKVEWNQFWLLYNLFQFFSLEWNKSDLNVNDDSELVEYTLEDLLTYFESNYHPILTDMYQNGLVKSEEDEQKLYSLTDNSGKLIAEADLIIVTEKIVYEPFSEEDKLVFEKNGYTIKLKNSLNKI